jgi:hypothetical protein
MKCRPRAKRRKRAIEPRFPQTAFARRERVSCAFCDDGRTAYAAGLFSYAFCIDEPPRSNVRMILRTIMHVASWDQLERVWEFIVGFFKFLWALLKFLGGAG